MTRLRKTIGVLVITFAIVGAVIIYPVSLHGSTAATASMVVIPSVTISPEEITRSAGAMPVLPVEKTHDMSFVFSDGD